MPKTALSRTICPAALLVAMVLAGCTTVTQMDYRPSNDFVPVPATPPQIAGVVANDHRKEAPRRLATNIVFSHAEALDTTKPVKDEVARVFTQALIARREITHDPSAPLVLVVDIYKFDADHYMRSQARIEMTISLMDRRTGQVLYRDDIADQVVAMQILDSSVSGLQAMAQQLLDRSVDRLLGKPGFLALAAPVSG